VLSVLIVDDDPLIAERLRPYFLPRYCPTHVTNYCALSELVHQLRPMLVVLNPHLDAVSAPVFWALLREQSQIPFIIVSPSSDPLAAIKALADGADDYLVKPYNPRELAARIEAVLRRYATQFGGAPRSSTSCAG